MRGNDGHYIKLEFPLKTPSLNKLFGRGHWSARAEEVKVWNKAVITVCKKEKVKPIKIFPVRITTMSFYKGKTEKDTSNTFPANKLIEDGLVLARVLPDDTPQYVAEHGVLRPEFGCKEDKVIVWVETLESIRKNMMRDVEEMLK